MAPRDAFGREIGEDAPSVPEVAQAESRSPERRARGIGRLAVLLLIVAAVAALVIVGSGGKDESASTSVAPAPKPRPVARRSLIGRDALAAALRRLHGHGRLRLLRLASDRLDAQLVTSAGRLRNVQITAAGDLRDLGAAGSGAGGLPTIPIGEVDPAAPARLVRAAARQAGRSPSRVDYLVLFALPGTGPSWNAFFKPDGLHFLADRHGKRLRRP